ncbi:DUF3307 domain-containing protein [Pseudomonas sp. IAC-BECa141]|uniref:DUF3307 domain-containing protein n=1 Tax=Pseudomonas sp. IAC-BECa141 TaxID=2793103 RepID=UPI00221EAB46|nr:DUF3307 domain-containing protein [Pseudomonas sp. IAC-BECa141]
MNNRVKEFFVAHSLHALTHSVVITAISVVWFFSNTESSRPSSIVELFNIFLVIGVILFFSHLCIDMLKEFVSERFVSYGSVVFLIDQFAHISIVFWLVLKFFYSAEYLSGKSNIQLELTTLTIFAISLVLLLRPASIFIVLFMSGKKIGGMSERIQITKSFMAAAYYSELAKEYASKSGADLHDELRKSKDKADDLVTFLKSGTLEVSTDRAFDSNGAGKWIGYIERVMIFVFFIFNQPAAIAGIMAIKTAFRFNDLKDDNDSARSEYIMIGTFLSFFITMIVAATAKFSIESIWDGSQVKIMDFDILHWLNTYIFRY